MRRSSPTVFFKVRKPRAGWYEITQHSSDSPGIGLSVAKVWGERRAVIVADALRGAAAAPPEEQRQ